jgi:uncharacterized protein (DUF305 family)
MNSKDSQDSIRENETSPKRQKALFIGIAGIVITAIGVAVTNVAVTNVVQAEQTSQPSTTTKPSSTIPKPMMPQQGMMMHGMMMAGEQTDRHFIEMMIPHHEGAVQMADLALKLSKHPEIRKLAESIKSDQTREIAQMKSWYKQWYGTEVPTAMNHHGMDHSGMMGMQKPTVTKKPLAMQNMMGMQNMMAVDLKALETAPDFDKAFIKEMIPHHKMALMMSSMIVDSDRPEMRTLSNAIVQAQSKEIESMRQWYQTWYK